MSFIKSILEEHKKGIEVFLFESGIRVPKGTYAAKIIYHQDLDGVFSAILTMNQLIKQGIPKERIKLSSINYGDNTEEVKKKLAAKKGQMVALVDFARLPKKGERKPDFYSDHHVTESTINESGLDDFIEKWKAGGGQRNKEIVSFMKSLSVKSDTPEERARVRNALKQYQIGHLVKQKPGKKPEHDLFSMIMREQKPPKKGGTKRAVSTQKGAGRIGKTDFPSESEHLATVHAQNLATGGDVAAISMIDSAAYKNLTDVIDIPKDFRSKGRMDRLANIVNVLMSSIIKKNPTAVNELIKNSSPSLASIYNNLLKVSSLHGIQMKALGELSKEDPNWDKIDELRSKLPTSMAKETTPGDKKQELATIEKSREKGKEDVEKHTAVGTTKYRKGSDVVIVQQASGRGQPSRFMGSLLTKPDGTRYPAHMREWATMLQISLNPSLDMSDKEKVNMDKLVKEAMNEVYMDIKGGKIRVGDIGLTNWAFTKVILPSVGGHKAIATTAGLGTLGLAPKADRERFKELEALGKRVKKLKDKKEMKDIMPKKAKELERIKEIKNEWKKEREMIVAEIKKRIIDKVTQKLKGVKPIPGEERFKVRKIKEEILNLSNLT